MITCESLSETKNMQLSPTWTRKEEAKAKVIEPQIPLTKLSITVPYFM